MSFERNALRALGFAVYVVVAVAWDRGFVGPRTQGDSAVLQRREPAWTRVRLCVLCVCVVVVVAVVCVRCGFLPRTGSVRLDLSNNNVVVEMCVCDCVGVGFICATGRTGKCTAASSEEV